MPALLRVKDVQSILNLSRSAAYALVNSGKLPILRVGRTILVDRADLEAFIAERKASDA